MKLNIFSVQAQEQSSNFDKIREAVLGLARRNGDSRAVDTLPKPSDGNGAKP